MARFREYLDYYRRKLESNLTDETIIVQVIEKLSRTDFPVLELRNSGIYSVVRSIGKTEGCNRAAFHLYNKWKVMLAAQDKNKILQTNIPVQNRVSEPLENDVNDSFKGQTMEVQNGFTENFQKNTINSASNITNFRPLRNQLPVNDIGMKSSNTVQPSANDMGFKMRNSTPPASDMGFKFRNSTPPANDGGYMIKSSSPVQPPGSSRGYKFKSSTPFEPSTNEVSFKVKNSTPVQPSTNNGGFNIKNSISVQPPVNKFQPFNNFSASFPVHNVNTNENLMEHNTMSELSVNFDTQSNCSNALSSPHSTNSQNPLDIGSTNSTSPNKIGRIPDPYTIEMKEGMFRIVKCYDGLTPELLRVKRLYITEEDNCDSDPEDRTEGKLRTKKRGHSPNNIKNSKSASNKSAEKSHGSKSKNNIPEKFSKHKINTEKHFGKSEKVKTSSPLNKSAIDKSKSEKKVKEKSSEALKNFSPHKVSSKSSSKSSPAAKSSSKSSPIAKSSSKSSPASKSSSKSSPAVKSSAKGSPSIKSNTKGSPMKTIIKESPMKAIIKGSPQVKSITKENPQIKSSTKGSPSVFINHANPSSCDIPRVNPAYRDCDKRTNKVLPNEATDSFMCSKKERTSVYSGKKSLQEIPRLHASCVRVLRKNIDCIKNTREVPYEVLKPVLQSCSATQLQRIEEHNHYLLTSTEEIWKSLCQRKYRDMKPTSTGTWRNLYWKTREDQEKRLKNITARVSASIQKTAPERQTKLTLIESPRNKKMKLSVPEPKPVLPKEPTTHISNLFKESNAPSHKTAHKESSTPSSHPKMSRESHSLGHKKPKKAPVAPLMSKVKKTILAMHKK